MPEIIHDNIPAALIRDGCRKINITLDEFSTAVLGSPKAAYYRFRNPGSWRVEELAHTSLLFRWTEIELSEFIGYFFPVEVTV